MSRARFCILQDLCDDKGDEIFSQFEQAVKVDESHFRLDHPELGQMPSGLALFRSEGRPKTIYLAEAHRGRFEMQLARLGQVQRGAEIIDFKKCLLLFTDCGCEDWCID